ncbi:unnamed protein product [Phytophthora lilii]|uniref:Unnamed protein product n=1 Tax=Phytophthora lilii TaxID=2077276 RepID=A0A9W7DCQ5_9STRA|nr:unnamed protein product [Phytophthora lilii]
MTTPTGNSDDIIDNSEIGQPDYATSTNNVATVLSDTKVIENNSKVHRLKGSSPLGGKDEERMVPVAAIGAAYLSMQHSSPSISTQSILHA